jgi:mono/diheme cytochrome c family protein
MRDEKTRDPMSTAPVPLWLISILLGLLVWGAWYIVRNAGSFDPRVYFPYHSLAEVVEMQPPQNEESDLLQKGERLFRDYCAVCHMNDGTGNPVNGCPPLVGSEWVAAPGVERLVRIVSKGLSGPVEVRGQVYDTGTMGAIGDQMPGDDNQKVENIAAILSYVRRRFAGDSGVVQPGTVAAIRSQIAVHSNNFTADELLLVPQFR